MKAIVMQSTGGPEVLALHDLAMPEIQKPSDLLVHLKAAGVNPVDTKLRRNGTFYPDHQPTILGCDGAGVIEAVGTEVTRFKLGDEIYFCVGGMGGPRGNYAEYTVIDERFAALKPTTLDMVHAAAAPLVLITAWESLHDRGCLQNGHRVLIHAGAGGVGHVAIQLAKLAGAKVCTTVGSSRKAQFVKQLQADEPILYKQRNFLEAVQEWTDDQGVDLAMDNVGGPTFHATFPAVKHYGDLVTLLQPASDVDWRVARQRNLRISFELMLTPVLQGLIEAQKRQAWILEQCARLFDSGKLHVHVEQTLPLAEAAKAHKQLEAGSTLGKIVLVVD
ncbi:MAG: zinc-dependent alcohol dehydrogenase family protein [Gammaproteobacteria bacterium]|nr:zinc-dependent alcohol dehydrogenase family protein [Gammaproteobacteria bacterium]MCI0590717.1 zinc-dependent alcohol dehydrogenase family protein [Gammaproteobacteria bacterium]